MSGDHDRPDSQPLEELRDLIGRLCDGEATADQIARLEELVCQDQACCEYYVKAMQVEAVLPRHVGSAVRSAAAVVAEWRAREEEGSAERINCVSLLADPILRYTGKMSRAAAALLIGSMCFSALVATAATILVIKTPAQAEHVVAPPNYVAQLTRARNLVWLNAVSEPMVDEFVTAGQIFEIVSGWAEISFKGGARVVLEGPATFVVETAESGRLVTGKLATDASAQASPFVVDTPTARVIDSGAEFGMLVESAGATTVNVFTGEVEVSPLANVGTGAIGKPERLSAGQAAIVKQAKPRSASARFNRLPQVQSRFVRTLRTRSHVLGNDCIGRASRDTAQGIVCLVRQPTPVTGRADSFSFYNVHADDNRWITPIILAFDRSRDAYRITGIGQSVLNLGSGVQTVPFQLIVGSADLQAGVHTFGFYHGTIDKTGKSTNPSYGPLDYDRLPKADSPEATPGEARWVFTPLVAGPVPLRLDLEFSMQPEGDQFILFSGDDAYAFSSERIYSGSLQILSTPDDDPLIAAANQAAAQ